MKTPLPGSPLSSKCRGALRWAVLVVGLLILVRLLKVYSACVCVLCILF